MLSGIFESSFPIQPKVLLFYTNSGFSRTTTFFLGFLRFMRMTGWGNMFMIQWNVPCILHIFSDGWNGLFSESLGGRLLGVEARGVAYCLLGWFFGLLACMLHQEWYPFACFLVMTVSERLIFLKRLSSKNIKIWKWMNGLKLMNEWVSRWDRIWKRAGHSSFD